MFRVFILKIDILKNNFGQSLYLSYYQANKVVGNLCKV